jgi:flagellar hook-associated protein 2
MKGGTKFSFTEQVSAADARITIDGLNVYSKSNTMTGVLPGVTMDLTNTSSNFKLTINRDDTAMIEKVQAFVDNYNTLVGFVDTNNNFSSDSGSRGSFFGDSTISGIMAGMGSAVGQIYTASDGSTELSLARMGIQTQQDGSLKLDTSELKDALAADYQDVVGAFTDPDGPVNALADQISDVYLDNSSGLVKLRTDTVESRIEDMEESIIDLEERITAQEERLRSQFTAMEVALGQLQSSQSYLDALLAQSSGKK